MRKHHSSLTNQVVTAFDRASQAQYQLEALIERVEEAIFQEQEAIRGAIPLEGGVNTMARLLLEYLHQTQSSTQPWERTVQDEVLALIDVKNLTGRIWPELRPTRKR